MYCLLSEELLQLYVLQFEIAVLRKLLSQLLDLHLVRVTVKLPPLDLSESG